MNPEEVLTAKMHACAIHAAIRCSKLIRAALMNMCFNKSL